MDKKTMEGINMDKKTIDGMNDVIKTLYHSWYDSDDEKESEGFKQVQEYNNRAETLIRSLMDDDKVISEILDCILQAETVYNFDGFANGFLTGFMTCTCAAKDLFNEIKQVN